MNKPAKPRPKKRDVAFPTSPRLPKRADQDSGAPVVVYRDVEVLRKFLTSSSKLMSRKRSSTTSQEQSAIRTAVKQARFLALLPYTGT